MTDIEKDSWYKIKFMVQTWTHGINKDSLYRLRLMVQTWINGIDKDSWYRLGLMVQTRTNGIDLDSWYSIGTPDSHMYKRAECYPYAGFLFICSHASPQ